MELLAHESGSTQDEGIAFLVQVLGLQRELREIGRQLDRFELEMRQELCELWRERFEESRWK